MAETDTPFQALPNMMHVAEHKRTAFVLIVPAETTVNDLLNPGALASCMQRHTFSVGCRIEVHGGRDWWVELLVVRVDTDRKRIYTKLLHKPISLSIDKDAAKADSLRIEKTVGDKWRVMRNDKALKADFSSKADAEAWATAQG